MADLYDCAVVGGGPAGLTAAVYLARFCRRAIVFSDGESRARWIPRTRNVPGYPHGIEGPELLERLHEHAGRYPVEIAKTRIAGLTGSRGGFVLSDGARTWMAQFVILAAGVHDIVPDDLGVLWSHVSTGGVRLCPVCDAYELRGKRIGLLARPERARSEASFLRRYSDSLLLFTHGLDPNAYKDIAADSVFASRIAAIDQGAQVQVALADGQSAVVDALYVGYGVEAHSALAAALGAECDAAGYLRVDQRQQTSVPGLYAAGDVAQSLSQISVAFGQAAIAASAINLELR